MDSTASALTPDALAKIRFGLMFFVLAGGVAGGYAASRWAGVKDDFARRLMSINLIVLSWPATLFAIWKMQLGSGVVVVPAMGVVLLLASTVFSVFIFRAHRLEPSSHLTAVMAGSLANLSHTGGAFVCYALFGLEGFALGNLYLAMWLPAVFVIWVPVLKYYEFRAMGERVSFGWRNLLDARLTGLAGVVVGILLNRTAWRPPSQIVDWYIMDFFIYSASAVAFFAIGMRLRISRLKEYLGLYFTLGAVRFLLTPAAAAGILYAWPGLLAGTDPLTRNVIMVQSAAPAAVLMVTMSNVFDLDSRMGSALWVVNTAAFAVVVVPVMFFIYM